MEKVRIAMIGVGAISGIYLQNHQPRFSVKWTWWACATSSPSGPRRAPATWRSKSEEGADGPSAQNL